MEDIEFKPWFNWQRGVIAYAITAYWKSKKRKVFDRPSGQKAHTYQIGCILRLSAASNNEARRRAEYIANFLNKWIPKHSVEELNEFLPVIKEENPNNLTAKQKNLWVKYRLKE